MKPIEPGCLCLIKNSRNKSHIGKFAEAVERVYYGYLLPSGKPVNSLNPGTNWLIKSDITNRFGCTGWGVFSERSLMRIDGEDFSHEVEQTEIGVTA